ncbi:PIN domain-like protein [Moniliophthora roreri]|nr:PIN domain-like protein [Moniliophthora roreri]
MRAYYLDEDTASTRTLPNDSGRPVSEETLGTLKAKFWTLNGSDAECKASLKQLGERNGFVGDNSQEYEFDLSKDGLPGMPDVPAHGKMDHFSRDSLLLMDVIACLHSGGVFADFKEPNTNRLIRISLTEGDAVFFPVGIVFHAHVNETIDSHLTAYAMFKSSKPFSQQLPFAWDQVHDKHPVRAAYIKDLGMLRMEQRGDRVDMEAETPSRLETRYLSSPEHFLPLLNVNLQLLIDIKCNLFVGIEFETNAHRKMTTTHPALAQRLSDPTIRKQLFSSESMALRALTNPLTSFSNTFTPGTRSLRLTRIHNLKDAVRHCSTVIKWKSKGLIKRFHSNLWMGMMIRMIAMSYYRFDPHTGNVFAPSHQESAMFHDGRPFIPTSDSVVIGRTRQQVDPHSSRCVRIDFRSGACAWTGTDPSQSSYRNCK